MSLSRREFITLTGTTAVCTCIGALGTSSCGSNPTSSTPPAPAGSYRVEDGRVYLALSELGTLLGVGEAVKLQVAGVNGDGRKLIVMRRGEADYRAFANACTHNGKELDYLYGEGVLACCGRSSRFNLAGDVLHGPAEEPQLRYQVWRKGAELIIQI